MNPGRIGPLAALFILAALLAPAVAQQPPPPYCENNPEFDQFDFWAGEWDVYSNDGKMTHFGANSVTKIARDCLVMEHWRADNGGRGYSMNFYNPLTGKWRQVWVANGHTIDYSGGLNEDGAMVLEGTIEYYATGVSHAFRGTWTPQDDGTVIQFFEEYDPETGALKPFSKDGLLYVRKEEGSVEETISAMLRDQAEAWNAGDFERYMAHVWKSDEFRYVADAAVITGWQNVMNLYRGYDTPGKRGLLSYDNIRVDPLSDNAAVVFAGWAVKHPGNPSADLSGVMTKVYKMLEGEWVATSVHFSTR